MKRWALGLAPFLGVWMMASCAPAPTISNVKSLSGTRAASFICLSGPYEVDPRRPLSQCTRIQDAYRLIDDYTNVVLGYGGSGGGSFNGGVDLKGEVPHLYAMVTQTLGQVAMVDLTAYTGNVLDSDPSSPGNNLFPVGEVPTGIVSTPGGTATFVTTGGDNPRPAIYALPSDGLRPCAAGQDPNCKQVAQTISSWPSCVLPGPAGAIAMVSDPVGGTGAQTRKTCDSGFEDVPTDVINDPTVKDLIDSEGGGRQKLVVSLPTLGELVVIDAQTMLESDAGSTNGCIIERSIPLEADVKPDNPLPVDPGPACVNPRAFPPGEEVVYVPQPNQITQSADLERMFISDLAAPVIHVVDIHDVCDLAELPPLLATSKEDPTRAVVTDSLAVTPRATASNKFYLYAVDGSDPVPSEMVFDVSPGSTQNNTPLESPNGVVNPLQPVDRISFTAAPVALQIMVRDQPKAGATHVAPFGTLCNPDPAVPTGCQDATPACEGTAYRTNTADYTTSTTGIPEGAGPLTLRGMFALSGLSNGQIAINDIEDFDQPCRGPFNQSSELGCPGAATGLVTSLEASCGAVVANEPRSANYILTNDVSGRHLPGVTTYPLLFDLNGVLIPAGADQAQMHAPLLPNGSLLTLAVDGVQIAPGSDGLIVDDSGTQQNALLLNLEDPRVHTVDQDWSVTFEGPLSGFTTQVGDLQLADMGGASRQLLDPGGSKFCEKGVQSFEAVREKLADQNPALSSTDLDNLARGLADRMTITSPLIDSTDSYWLSVDCTFAQCTQSFGDDTLPTLGRDIVIHEAYEDHLELEAPGAGDALVKCCFPADPTFQIRPANQWVVIGATSGFQHHVIADTSSDPNKAGRCRDSCDPRLKRMNGRVSVTSDPKAPVLFQSPQFNFFVTSSIVPSSATGRGTKRDDAFKFSTEGSFIALDFLLTSTDVPNVTPQSMTFLPQVDRVIVTDGGSEGLLLVSGDLQGNLIQLY